MKSVLVLDTHFHDLLVLEDFDDFHCDEITHIFHGLAQARNGDFDAVYVLWRCFRNNEAGYVDGKVLAMVVLAPNL